MAQVSNRALSVISVAVIFGSIATFVLLVSLIVYGIGKIPGPHGQ